MELTRGQAIELSKTKWWANKSAHDIVRFQLFTRLLCMPFDVFHKAVEEALGRPVWTHEFAYSDDLKKEFLGDKPAPTFEEVVALVPRDKLIVIGVD